ncbi:MAG: Rieske 2Fe-2S domain-containing protein, partial [Alphaproteobacteria bacterium]|nr:Rieske 2Fe-2S domain-containing protein [Alphaproteobacteria bacterium]
GIPLTSGRFDGKEVECCYHGWRFNEKGKCTEIPSLAKGQDFDLSKIKVKTYPCEEVQGNIWVFLGDEKANPKDIPLVPNMMGAENTPRLAFSRIFPCSTDHAIIGLMDPAHGPYVHQSWFWRSKKSSHEKQKQFAPVPRGFQMCRHRASKNSKAYKLLGGVPETEITFTLPGVRREHIQTGKHSLCSLTTITPIDENTSQIHQTFYWTMPWLVFFKPLLTYIAKTFLDQDRDAIIAQGKGLEYNPPLMLINDADTQAKWYFRLKKEHALAQEEKRAFKNPVKECILQWKS